MANSPRLDLKNENEFPTLGNEPVDLVLSSKRPQMSMTEQQCQESNDIAVGTSSEEEDQEKSAQKPRRGVKIQSILSEDTIYGDHFLRCRIGVRSSEYRTDLRQFINQNQLGDFIITPINNHDQINPKSSSKDKEPAAPGPTPTHQTLPDLILNREEWQSRVVVELSFPLIEDYHRESIKKFEDSFRHAIYLEIPVILISCPSTEIACLTIASVINDMLDDRRASPSILIKLPFINISDDQDGSSKSSSNTNSPIQTTDSGQTSLGSHANNQSPNYSGATSDDQSLLQPWPDTPDIDESKFIMRRNSLSAIRDIWEQWCAFRSHLNPMRNIGICLDLNDEFMNNYVGFPRWTGEPIRMILLQRHHFVTTPGIQMKVPRLTYRCQDFLTQLVLANSLKTGLVIDMGLKENHQPNNNSVAQHLIYLDKFYNSLIRSNQDKLRSLDDQLQLPLQPLSSNLSSDCYATFESDKRKYSKYKSAMIEALKFLSYSVNSDQPREDPIILMVLGAGRGPLVDCFIEAIEELGLKNGFKIYALDKNPSSVVTLRHKLATDWSDRFSAKGNKIQVEVVESDMRIWDPEVKADIIATELLGSFGDNELSPECIDGLWRFSTERTISIPQEYTSYIAPITSYKIHQNVLRRKIAQSDSCAFDRIYVVKLNNIHMIAQPQPLFKFSHLNISEPPTAKPSNERYTKLIFYSRLDTICHGFGAYFHAKLYGTKSISTVPETKTSKMDSWFPAFVPLECPIRLPKGSTLEINFWRKESSTSVWYEWVVTQPTRSRIHSLLADGKGMSKMI